MAQLSNSSAGGSREVLLDTLRAIVGGPHLLTSDSATRRYRTGFRFGGGSAMAVVRPGSLVEMWRVFTACAGASVILIPQAANTGLTGGSTPDGDAYDRDVVILSTRRLKGLRLIRDNQQVLCLPGSSLYELEDLAASVGREPHSRIGSSCIGASILGGVCNNSGGALIHRGPAFTQLALYGRINAVGEPELVNHLGIDLGQAPETILSRLEAGQFGETDIHDLDGRHASDPDYQAHLRELDAPTPARFNNDPRRLFEAAGSGGHLLVFAVRLDTFDKPAQMVDFYVGTNDPADLNRIRRRILHEFDELPIQGEYIHRSAFELTARYGKDTFLAIQTLGPKWLPRLLALKANADAFFTRLPFVPNALADMIVQFAVGLLPRHLPERLYDYDARYEHHLILRMGGPGVVRLRSLLEEAFPSVAGECFECTRGEGERAFLHRFAVAGASIRYRALHPSRVSSIVALDVALRRNDDDWNEKLPPDLADRIVGVSYCAHFFCRVFHRDYFLKPGEDPIAFEHAMWALLDANGAEYPAEHNVGHLYKAKPALVDHYRRLDPTNSLNPGTGMTSRLVQWR